MKATCAVLTIMALWLVPISGTGVAVAASGVENGSGVSPAPTSSAPDAAKPASPARLYEAVSGYSDGIRGTSAPKREKESGKPKYRPPTAPRVSETERELRRVFELESAQARTRIRRKEWDLAVRSIQRALDAAGKLDSAETGSLRDMLEKARVKLERPAEWTGETLGEMTNSIGMKMELIQPGSFLMGSSLAEIRRLENTWIAERELFDGERPAHSVRITKPFFLGKYEVTSGQFRRFVEETGYVTVAEKQGWGWVYDKEKKHWVKKQGACWNNPGGDLWDDQPVTLVCHRDAEAFCKWLSTKDHREYYLPTEAQWEYAARGGKEGKRYPWGDAYPDGRKMNVADRRSLLPWADRTVDDGYGGPAPVGSYEPNDFWLYDMTGNVWEFCSDNYASDYYRTTSSDNGVDDPQGPRRGKTRVVRGGNWAFGSGIARNAFRFGIDDNLCTDINGFRVAALATQSDAPPDSGSTMRSSRATGSESPELAVAKIKNLVAKGRRKEARRLADRFLNELAKDRSDGESTHVVSEILEALIDVKKDESIQSFSNSLGMKMIRIPEGSFVMGSAESDIAWAMTTLAQGQPLSLENEYPFHKVRLSRPFYLSETEITVGQFRTFVEQTGYITDAEHDGGGQVFDEGDNRFRTKAGSSWKNPGWKITDSQPVTVVSYYDAVAFCDWLTAKEKLPYKLPTEAQWEYSARGGHVMAQFPWGDALPDGRKANYADRNTKFEWRDRFADDGYEFVAPVGSYEANDFGLYDMAGNVLEWVRDYYGEDYYRMSPEVDPEGPGHGENRVTKGGEWTFGPVNLRCAFRGWSRPDMAFYNTGFRVAIDFSNTRRIFHFTRNFLTNEWVPGPDQREVAQAVAKEQDRRKRAARATKASEAPKKPAVVIQPATTGVKILDFTPKADARKADMELGDIIIEYDGVRNLTAQKLLSLCGRTKKERTRPVIVFIRNGYEYSVRANPGFLGITVVNTRVKGPFKKPETPRRHRQRDEKPDRGSDRLDWT